MLEDVFKGTDVTFSMLNNQIILSNRSTDESTQQKQTVKGKVVGADGEPIIGATVMEEGTTNGTITDMDGLFKLEVKSSNNLLRFSYVGYKDKTVKMKVGTELIITLLEDTEMIDEVVVVGYGKQSRAKVTSAISKLEGSRYECQQLRPSTSR